jgi:hypothetical protein
LAWYEWNDPPNAYLGLVGLIFSKTVEPQPRWKDEVMEQSKPFPPQKKSINL